MASKDFARRLVRSLVTTTNELKNFPTLHYTSQKSLRNVIEKEYYRIFSNEAIELSETDLRNLGIAATMALQDYIQVRPNLQFLRPLRTRRIVFYSTDRNNRRTQLTLGNIGPINDAITSTLQRIFIRKNAPAETQRKGKSAFFNLIEAYSLISTGQKPVKDFYRSLKISYTQKGGDGQLISGNFIIDGPEVLTDKINELATRLPSRQATADIMANTLGVSRLGEHTILSQFRAGRDIQVIYDEPKTDNVSLSKAEQGRAGTKKGRDATRRPRRESRSSLRRILTILRNNINQAVALKMRYPRLVYRTGRFARSVRIPSIRVSDRATTINYTYRVRPYGVFRHPEGDPTLANPQRDPRTLIRQTIRELVQQEVRNVLHIRGRGV